jgi:molecular chaperone HtpG
MPADQKEVYYLIGENREVIENSPLLETFKSKRQEVLFLTDPVDEFVVQALLDYKGKALKPVNKGEADGAIDPEKKVRFGPLLDLMRQKLPEVTEVRLSNRLKESAVCLVADEWSVGPHMQRLMQQLGRSKELPPGKRILEVNPDHPAVQAVQRVFEHDKTDGRLEGYFRILYDEAVIADGARLKDPAGFTKRVNELLTKDATIPVS